MTRSAHAAWDGDLKSGKGTLSTESKAISDAPYSFKTRFEEGVSGTNPEELLAAAHAACFAMALSHALNEAGIHGTRVEAKSDVTIENLAVTKSALTATVSAPVADEEQVRQIAEDAKANCPISKVINADITLDLTVK